MASCGKPPNAGPSATGTLTGGTIVLRQNDVETLSHDPRLQGIGLLMFDLMGITDGPLRDWYGRLMPYCLGTALAKIAVEEYLRAVLAAEPALRLAEDPVNIPGGASLGAARPGFRSVR